MSEHKEDLRCGGKWKYSLGKEVEYKIVPKIMQQ